jgi:predicted PurR-regulated permease PerM
LPANATTINDVGYALITNDATYALVAYDVANGRDAVSSNALNDDATRPRLSIIIIVLSMIIVIIGGTIWGISGMFLAIPITGIIKVILDHIPSLKPYGYLLGKVD